MSDCNRRTHKTHSRLGMITPVLAVFGLAAMAFAADNPAAPAATPAAVATAPAQTQPAGPAPKFRCDEPDYKFGEVWAMEKVEHTFIVHNDGQADLTIEARPTCGCTVAEYDKVIAPGGQGKVKTILSTGNYTTHYKKVINVITNDPLKPNVPLSLEGDVKQRISSEPHLAAYFGQLAPGLELTRKFKLTNNSDQPMKLEIVPPATPTCFKAELKELEPGKVAEITVTAAPPFQDNTNAAQFTIKTGIEGVPDMTLPCSLIKPPAVQVVPPIVRIPPSPLNNLYRQPVTVRNNTENPLKVLSAECNDSRIKVEPTETAPGKLWTISLEIPTGYTPQPEQAPLLTIKTDYKDNPVFTVPILSMASPRPPTTAPVASTPELLIGKVAPQVAVQLTDGRSVQIGQGGQVTLVNFWASWCTPSRTQLPMLDELYQTYRRKGVEFINVSVDQYRPIPELTQIMKDLDSKIPLATDTDHRIVKAFAVAEAPTVVLIGKNGIVEAVRRGIGRDDRELNLVSKSLQEQLDKLLEGKTRADFAPLPISIGTPCRLQQLPNSLMSAAGGTLMVEALRQDAGLFKPKSKGEYKLYYRNTGTTPLEVKSIKPASLGLTIDESYTKTLAPGSTAFVLCRFEAPDKPETFAHQLTFETSGANPILNISITGKVKQLIEFQPVSGIDFSNNVRKLPMRIATVVYNGSGQLEFKAPKSSSPKFEASIESRPHNIWILTVKALPPFEEGETTAAITIETNQPEQPVVEVPVKLSIPKRIEVTPASITLPQSRTTQQASVSIVNSGESALNVLEVKKSRPEIQTQFYPDTDGRSYKLQITVPSDFACGPKGETITIRTDDKEFGEIVIPVRGGAGPGFARPRGTAPLPTK